MTEFFAGLQRLSCKLRWGNWLLVAAGLLFFGGQASAQGFTVSIAVDEDCHGSLSNSTGFSSSLPCTFLDDPGPGGLSGVMTYGLLNPPGLVSGDVFLQDGAGGPILDVIRFNATEVCSGTTGCLVFYSDNTDGFDALADTPSPPGAFYTNTITLLETGIEGGAQGATYTPADGQPGFVGGAAGPVTYFLVSDSASIPEPATLALLTLGFAGLGFARRKQ